MIDQERRRFHRVLFSAKCDLHQGSQLWRSQVQNISLKGLLLSLPEGWKGGDVDAPLQAVINLGEDAAIVMAVQLRRASTNQLAFICQYIDLESAAHLRRLVELNLGDDALLHQDLVELGQPEQRV